MSSNANGCVEDVHCCPGTCGPLQLKETKSGANKGRLYLKCGCCDFFIWYDKVCQATHGSNRRDAGHTLLSSKIVEIWKMVFHRL
ncbi:unnamed protein product [Cuscuta epithymum]|uniref:Zinc finger GRF-type domain-containing protein n=1 Tax=Cuscuta epithymum TaxID=186058 RepID=A0AAV0F9X7_9ASTE|nr:unnamed protein product [Cuscuta epithymum]